MNYYKTDAADLFFTLYWHPETSQNFLKYIPNSASWVGFEHVLWKKVPEDKKLTLIEELGGELDRMEENILEGWWKRFRDWRLIHSQLTLIATYLDQNTDFVEFGYADPTLRPGFQWILDKRGPGFDPEHISSTIASGETVSIFPKLVEHLLETPERKRLECFSRLLAKIAETKPEAEQAGTGQPATRPLSDSGVATKGRFLALETRHDIDVISFLGDKSSRRFDEQTDAYQAASRKPLPAAWSLTDRAWSRAFRRQRLQSSNCAARRKGGFSQPHPQRPTDKGAVNSMRRFSTEAGEKP